MRPWHLLGSIVALVLIGDGVVLSMTSRSGATRHPGATAASATMGVVTPVIPDPALSGQVQPPAPGLYRYHSAGLDRAGPDWAGADWAERIVVEAASPAGTRVRIRTTTPPGIDQVVEFSDTAETQISYAQAGTSVADEVTCAGGPVPVLQLPLATGDTWVTTSECTNLLGDSLVDEHRVRVVGPTTQPVGSTTVPVWELVVVSDQTSTPATGGPSHTQSTTTTLDVSAEHGLVVRQVVQRGDDPRTLREDRLVSLTPT